MHETKASDKYHYDTIVVGSGLTGLILAHMTASSGQRVLLLESREEFGGHLKPALNEKGALRSSLEFVPNDKLAPLIWLQEYLDIAIVGAQVEIPPVTFDNGEFKTFVGFGDQKFRSRDEVNWYCAEKRIPLTTRPEEWIRKLRQSESFHKETMHEVTAYNWSPKGVLQSVTVNGSKTFWAKNFIHTAPISKLPDLLPEPALKARERIALAKAEGWTSVGLHFTHAEVVTTNEAIHILKGSSTDFEPCLGRFFTATGEPESSHQDSVWITLINDEHAEDMEYIGATLRHMKKQIRRAYPTALESQANEKIIVTSQGQGHCGLKLKEPFQLSQISNLWLASHLLSEQRGVGASVEVAQRVFEVFSESTECGSSKKDPLRACPEHSVMIPQ